MNHTDILRWTNCWTMANLITGFKNTINTQVDIRDMYLCDNQMQFETAMNDFEYTKWLDPAGVPCYIKDE